MDWTVGTPIITESRQTMAVLTGPVQELSPPCPTTKELYGSILDQTVMDLALAGSGTKALGKEK